jgi:hypothetical protein
MKRRIFMKSLIMKFRFLLSCALLATLLGGCEEVGVHSFQESTLSDTPVSDPSLMRVNISIAKESVSPGNYTQHILAHFRDRRGSLIELKDGKISVNGIKMQHRRDPIFETSYYSLNENLLPVLANTTYTFTITLADGREYTAAVKTPEKDLHTLLLPATHHRNQSLTLKWLEAGDPVKLTTTRYYRLNNDEKFAISQVQLTNPAAGEHTFPASFFTEYPATYRVNFTVISTTSGQVDSRFAAGSSISAELSTSAAVAIE